VVVHGNSSSAEDRALALTVWRAAREAEGKDPDAQRVARVTDKLDAPDVLLVCASRDLRVVGMALAEPFRDSYGHADVVADTGHVSMVFVHPSFQRCGVGHDLMRRLVARSPWRRLSLWTRDDNEAARRLYARCGFAMTSDRGLTPHGDAISRWERPPSAAGA
jgi:ribosomal protein S18 acetylase RimI-like enzyme